ncbi:60S ribosomal protein L31 [Candidatus Woesearchaeota archaeon]|nr:60S ribosomal protein L31 [Candidatus Woesearchaeota archaeon]
MAKKETAKNVLERVYNVPLRKEYMKAPNWKRTPKAVKALRQFISKHMKSENVVIGKYANQLLWKNGIKNPPHHVRVNAVKDDKGKVTVELVDLPGKAKREEAKLKEAEKKKETKKEEKEAKEKTEKLVGKEVKEAQFEEVVEEVKKEKEEKAKEIQKEEIKELKEEQKKHHAAVKQPKEQRFQETHPTAPRSQ